MPPIRRQKPAESPRPKRRVAGRSTRPAAPEATGWDETPADETPAAETDDAEPAAASESPSAKEPEAEVETTPASKGAATAKGDRAVTDADADARTDADATAAKPAGRSALGMGTLAAFVVGIVAAITGLALVIASLVGGDDDGGNAAFVDEAATEEVLTESAAAVQRLVAIDYERLDEYHGSLGEFLAPQLVDELNETWDALRETYTQTETVVDAQVREIGLTQLDGDHAEVLLVQDVSMTREGTAAGSTSGTYLVGMTRIDGVWKISRIPDLPS